MAKSTPTNEEIAALFEQIADLLENKDEDNPFRIRAYRQGAERLRALDQSVAAMARRNDPQALEAIPDIGSGLAALISEFVTTGRSTLLDDLQGNNSAVTLLAQVPGLGPELADRIVQKLKIETLPELEQAAHDGRLEKVEGFGPRRVEAVKVGLSGLLTRSAGQRRQRLQQGEKQESKTEGPSVGLLLALDEEYRRKAEADELRKIAPRRFNPDHEAWLPVMDVEREGWSFTVLYSNTARAHELNMTRDWVVIYYKKQNVQERQNTVVTATREPLAGKRVVRGREKECQQYYASQSR